MSSVKCSRCRHLENKVALISMLLEAVDGIMDGKEVSDFALSFAIVRKVQDFMDKPRRKDAKEKEV